MICIAHCDDTGQRMDRARAIAIGDALFEPRHAGQTLKIRQPDNGGTLYLAGKPWRLRGTVAWPGSWAWMGYQLRGEALSEPEPAVVLRFLAWLRRRELMDCTSGPSPIFTWFNREGHVAEIDLLRALATELEG